MAVRRSGSTLARPMTLQWFGSPPNAYCKAKPDWSAEPAAEIVGGNPRVLSAAGLVQNDLAPQGSCTRSCTKSAIWALKKGFRKA